MLSRSHEYLLPVDQSDKIEEQELMISHLKELQEHELS